MRAIALPDRDDDLSGSRFGVIAATGVLMVLLCGCQGAPTCHDIDRLTEDANGNGFLDIAPPEGVVFDGVNTVKVFGGNTLVPADLLPHVAEVNLSPTIARLLVNTTEFRVKFSFDLVYEGGQTQTICQTKPSSNFELKMEAACPQESELNVALIALLPLFGGIPVRTIPVGLTTDAVDYECGQTVSLLTTKDENGEVV